MNIPITLTLENWEARYYCISPIINGIALIGINEIYNGIKAIQSVHWQDIRASVIIPGIPWKSMYLSRIGNSNLRPIINQEMFGYNACHSR